MPRGHGTQPSRVANALMNMPRGVARVLTCCLFGWGGGGENPLHSITCVILIHNEYDQGSCREKLNNSAAQSLQHELLVTWEENRGYQRRLSYWFQILEKNTFVAENVLTEDGIY